MRLASAILEKTADTTVAASRLAPAEPKAPAAKSAETSGEPSLTPDPRGGRRTANRRGLRILTRA